VDKYVIELCESLSKGIRQYLARESGKRIEEVTRKNVANELFDIILAEIDWNLKYKFDDDVDWEFYVTPIEESKGEYSIHKKKE